MTSQRNALKVEEWRSHRRAFIAACDAAHVDAIARVHPVRGSDGKPLFMDSAALGPRDATKALLVVTGDAAGSRLLTALLAAGVTPPPGARLVLVHALDPAAFAGGGGDPAWARAALRAVATEDLSKVAHLAVLDLTGTVNTADLPLGATPATCGNTVAGIESALAALA